MNGKDVVVLKDIPYYDNMGGKELNTIAQRGDILNILKEELCHEGKIWFKTVNGWLMGITSDKKCFIHKCYL